MPKCNHIPLCETACECSEIILESAPWYCIELGLCEKCFGKLDVKTSFKKLTDLIYKDAEVVLKGVPAWSVTARVIERVKSLNELVVGWI